MDFGSLEYARTRLTNSLVRLGDRPVWIRNVIATTAKGKVAKLLYCDSHEGRNGKCRQTYLPSRNLNLTPVPLGMLNDEDIVGVTCYVQRTPARAWKTGLSDSNSRLYAIDKEVEVPGYVLTSKALPNTIAGIYPSLTKCKELLKEDGVRESWAWSREFALHRDGNLLYKTRGKVGALGKDDTLVLDDKWRWLQELLDKRIEENG